MCSRRPGAAARCRARICQTNMVTASLEVLISATSIREVPAKLPRGQPLVINHKFPHPHPVSGKVSHLHPIWLRRGQRSPTTCRREEQHSSSADADGSPRSTATAHVNSASPSTSQKSDWHRTPASAALQGRLTPWTRGASGGPRGRHPQGPHQQAESPDDSAGGTVSFTNPCNDRHQASRCPGFVPGQGTIRGRRLDRLLGVRASGPTPATWTSPGISQGRHRMPSTLRPPDHPGRAPSRARS